VLTGARKPARLFDEGLVEARTWSLAAWTLALEGSGRCGRWTLAREARSLDQLENSTQPE
jgi:hypothetical protein